MTPLRAHIITAGGITTVLGIIAFACAFPFAAGITFGIGMFLITYWAIYDLVRNDP